MEMEFFDRWPREGQAIPFHECIISWKRAFPFYVMYVLINASVVNVPVDPILWQRQARHNGY